MRAPLASQHRLPVDLACATPCFSLSLGWPWASTGQKVAGVAIAKHHVQNSGPCYTGPLLALSLAAPHGLCLLGATPLPKRPASCCRRSHSRAKDLGDLTAKRCPELYIGFGRLLLVVELVPGLIGGGSRLRSVVEVGGFCWTRAWGDSVPLACCCHVQPVLSPKSQASPVSCTDRRANLLLGVLAT